MSNGIVVDYMGDGNFMQAFHPQMKVTNVFSEIDLPDITMTTNDVTYDYPFTLPYPIDNPFFKPVNIPGVDCYFVPVNKAEGKWIMRMCGNVTMQRYANQTTWIARYSTPCTNQRGVNIVLFLEAIVVKHLEIMNELGNITVDENYSVPMLVMKGRITASNYIPPTTYPPGYVVRDRFVRDYSWHGRYTLFSSSNLADFGDLFEGITIDDGDEIIAILTTYNQDNIVVGRCVTGSYAIIPFGGLSWDKYTKIMSLYVGAYCELKDAKVDVAIYKTTNITPSSYGMVIQDGSGKILYDVMKPPMMFLGSVSGTLNVSQYEAGRFTMTIPDGISPDDCYITRMSGTPYYSAYNITANGVTWGDTPFKSVMSFPSPTTLQVSVVRLYAVAGSNSSFGYGGFFENVVYCPYPYGLYLDPSKL